MIKKSILVLVAITMMSSTAWSATISGKVTWKGKVPKLRPINMEKEPVCMKKYGGKKPVSEALVIGSGNTMGNVYVKVTSGLPAGKKYDVPKAPVIINQEGCSYKPHIAGVMKRQKILFRNSDGILHNVHALPKKNRPFNISMPATMKESKPKKFKKTEDMFVIKCDVHPWMKSYVAVTNHPYYAVTKVDGKFNIPNLPAGTYELEAWHEKAGTRKGKLTVGDSDTKTWNVTFSK